MKRNYKRNQLTAGKFHAEPQWRTAASLLAGTVPPDVAAWLFDGASLTARLRQACDGQFGVKLLQQRWQRPLLCERQALGLDDRALALVRQVHLYCDGQAKVFARTVMPGATLRGRYRRLARLGGRPLGEMLFRDKSMSRSNMEVAAIESGQLFYDWAITKAERPRKIWGRRSVFTVGGRPLLVNEVFLPPLPAVALTNKIRVRV